MKQEVIEAADEAFWRDFEKPGHGQLNAMAAAITAADAARANDLRKAVKKLVRSAVYMGRADVMLDQSGLGGEMGFQDAGEELHAANRELLALFNIAEGGNH